jgi:hypothetical protein
LSAQVHRPVRLDFEVMVEVERMVSLSAVLAESWCLLEPFAWVELY